MGRMGKRDALWLGLALAAGAIGYLAGKSGDSASRSDPDRRDGVTQAARRTPARSPRAEKPEAEPEPEPALTLAEAMRRAGIEATPENEARVRKKAAELRRTHLAAVRRAEELAAATVRRELKEEAERRAKERALLEDTRRGGVMQLLDRLADEPTPVPALVADRERFAGLFARREEGPLLNGLDWSNGKRPPDGASLRFPPGRHAWKVGSIREDFPKDLLVEGAGMDRTLVRLDEVQARSEVRSLTFRDLTIDCGNDYFTHLRRGEGVTIRLERCRVVRFDMGAGGSVMLAAERAAFYATECVFEAGFGRAPGSGSLWRVGEAFVARLDDCRVVGPFRRVLPSEGTVHFERCSFENLTSRTQFEYGRAHEGVVLVDCTFDFLPPDTERRRKPRSLAELNPAWGDEG